MTRRPRSYSVPETTRSQAQLTRTCRQAQSARSLVPRTTARLQPLPPWQGWPGSVDLELFPLPPHWARDATKTLVHESDLLMTYSGMERPPCVVGSVSPMKG